MMPYLVACGSHLNKSSTILLFAAFPFNFFFGLLSQPALTQMMMINAFWFTYRVSFVGTNRCYRPHILKAFAHRLILICVFVCTNAPSTYETFILNQSV